MKVKHIFIVFIFIYYNRTHAKCSDSCICNSIASTCFLTQCKDLLPYYFTNEITLYGQLCDNHRQELHNNYKETSIILKNDYCKGLQNCVYVFILIIYKFYDIFILFLLLFIIKLILIYIFHF